MRYVALQKDAGLVLEQRKDTVIFEAVYRGRLEGHEAGAVETGKTLQLADPQVAILRTRCDGVLGQAILSCSS